MRQEQTARLNHNSTVIQHLGCSVNFSELEKLLERSDRFRRKLQIKDGQGAKWSYTFENGETHFYSIEGVKPPEEIEDEVTTIFLWLWSLKDYVHKYVMNKGKSKAWVESRVNADPYLCICADLANSLKHGGFDPRFKSRSNKNPMLGKLNYQIPQKAMGSITVGVFDVGLNVSNPSLVVLEMPVTDDNGRVLGDAFKYLNYGLKAWEGIVNEVENAV